MRDAEERVSGESWPRRGGANTKNNHDKPALAEGGGLDADHRLHEDNREYPSPYERRRGNSFSARLPGVPAGGQGNRAIHELQAGAAVTLEREDARQVRGSALKGTTLASTSSPSGLRTRSNHEI